MNEAEVEEETMHSEEQAPIQAQTTAGALLRQAREAARMQLPVLAATLKVPQRKLEALEADDYAAFPDHVFMRALAMGMCRALHIESEPVLALLPRRELKSLAHAGPGINEAVKLRSNFRATGTPLDSGNSSSRKIAVGVLVLLIAAAAVYFVPLHQSVDGVQSEATDSVTTQTEVVIGADSAAAVALGQASSNGETDSVAVVTESVAEPVANGAVPAAATTAAASAATAAEVAPAASSGALLALKVNTGQSWVKVKDASGKVVLERTLSKDESATAEGQLPLSVIVGNARGTQVTVRGEPFDISTMRDNVARFEVK